MNILGIETSCDETSIAIVNEKKEILVNLVYSQLKEHEEFVGVVPEIAARAHLQHIKKLLPEALNKAGLTYADLDGIAATGGPGLIGGVIVGVMTGKALASVHNLPFIAVNHLEGHLLTPRLTHDVEFPYLALLVSGGHSQILIARNLGDYKRLATTIDDAVGETFDKSAKILGLGYPGGPKVEKLAKTAKNTNRFGLPRPMLHNKTEMNFSLSGLKTAVKIHAEKCTVNGKIAEDDVADLCAELQTSIGDILVNRVEKALLHYIEVEKPKTPTLVVSGGVAANQYIRSRLQDLTKMYDACFIAPPMQLCADNAAMIAWAGLEHLQRGDKDGLDFNPRPRWPLDEETKSVVGSLASKSGIKV